MQELEQAKTELGNLYTATTEPETSPLELLRRYVAYAGFLKTNPVLSRLIAAIRKQIASASIVDIQKSMADPVYGKVVQMRQDIQDLYEEEREFPMHVLVQLEDAYNAFNALGDSDSDEEFEKKALKVKHETHDGTDGFSETLYGKGLLLTVQYSFIKDVPTLHAKLLEDLDSVSKSGPFPMYLDYDPEKGILYVEGKPVQITKRKSLTNAHYLLEYLFANDPFEKHFYDDLEEVGNEVLGKTPRVYYGTCEEINEKVEEATGIKQFLDFSSGQNMYVRINPDYAT